MKNRMPVLERSAVSAPRMDEVPEEDLDSACLGDNPDEYTGAEFFDHQV